MSIDQLQLTLIAEERHHAQPLPPEVREVSIELLARMLLGLVRHDEAADASKEGRDESR